MKKITLMLLAALLMTAAGSCTKDPTPSNDDNNTNNDGVYFPKEQISKYYYQDGYYFEKVLKEYWNWDGRKVTSIDHMTDYGSISWTESFTYMVNRVTRVDKNSDKYVEYTYNNNGLNKSSYYSNSVLRRETQFRYGSNNKVGEIVTNYYDDDRSDVDGGLRLLAKYLPEDVVARIKAKREARGTMDTETVTIKLTWNGDNISKATVNWNWEEEEDGYSGTDTEEFILRYDTKTNPKKGLLRFYTFDEEFDEYVSFFCKNNPLQITYSYATYEYEYGVLSYQSEGSGSYVYDYEYDAMGCPLTVTETHNHNDGSSYSYTHYYEYQ